MHVPSWNQGEIHHTRLSTYQTSFLNFFKIFSRTFFLTLTYADSFDQKNVRAPRSIAIKREKGNCPDLRGALLGERVGQHLSYESDPGSQDEQSPRRWYRATIHNTCTCRRGKVDGRDLDARGSRVPEAARTITNSAEAG